MFLLNMYTLYLNINLYEKKKKNKMNYDEKIHIDIHIEKVKKRVPRWKRKPDNFNHKILNAFFVLSEQLEQVSFTDLWYHCITKYGNDTKKPII